MCLSPNDLITVSNVTRHVIRVKTIHDSGTTTVVAPFLGFVYAALSAFTNSSKPSITKVADVRLLPSGRANLRCIDSLGLLDPS